MCVAAVDPALFQRQLANEFKKLSADESVSACNNKACPKYLTKQWLAFIRHDYVQSSKFTKLPST